MQHIQKFRDFATNERGAVAVVFAVMAIVIIMIGGGAVDFGKAYLNKDELQRKADEFALNGACSTAHEHVRLTEIDSNGKIKLKTGYTMTDYENAVVKPLKDTQAGHEAFNRQSIQATEFNKDGSANYSARWLNQNELEVLADTKVPLSFLTIVPTMGDSMQIRVRSVSQVSIPTIRAGSVTWTSLSYEAADYNQIWSYCYDKDWRTKGTRASDEGTGKVEQYSQLPSQLMFARNLATSQNKNGRSDLTLIQHNGPDGQIPSFAQPTCKDGETVSYMMYNQRNQRTSPSNWGNNSTNCRAQGGSSGSSSCYTWFTDTTLPTSTSNPESYANDSVFHSSGNQIETVLCDDANCSRLTESGTRIPGNNQANRTPQKARQSCQPGKFMYFGWEDRPGGDRDYDDIRYIVSCPEPVVSSNNFNCRLVK